jgi:gliding motility-associated-like protein
LTLTAASTDSVSYQWSGGGINDNTPVVRVNPAVSTTYSVDVVDTNGCTNTESIAITVMPYPVFSMAGNGTHICNGESTIIMGLGNSGYQYQWIETNEVTMSITVTPSDTTTYHLKVTDGFCSKIDSVTIIVHPIPVATISGPPLMCLGDIVPIKATGGITYHWDPYASTADSILVSPPSDTTYMVIAEAYNCLSPPVFLDVMVSDTNIQAIIIPTVDPCGNTALFTDGSLNSRTYLWKFHDGVQFTTANATHSYDISGIYPVSLVINRGVGCSDSTTYMVDYWSDHITDIYIPNSFTPNFDGLNEKFEILGNVDCFFGKLQIFDRWGIVIFETDKPGSDFWDGKINMKAVPEGIYNYLLSGKKYSRSGTVTVIKAY